MRRAPPRSLSRLPALLLAATPALATAAEPDPSWVFFADRGRDDAATSAAVAARTAELSPRALERRRRARHDHGVDVRDLEPAPAYVAAVLATGARLRSSSRWLNAVSVVADAEQRAAIAALPAVARLQPLARRAAAPPEAPPPAGAPRSADDEPYGVAFAQLDRLGVPRLHGCGLTGAGVVVGVQDSGFSLEHVALAGVDVVAAHDFIDDDDDVANEPGDPKGQHNHGTMVLSLLAGDDPGGFMGAAPGVSVILAKTEDKSVEEPFEEDRFVEGLEWIEATGADLFTSSLGYIDWYAPEQLDGATAVTTKAASVALEQGLIMFGAVGNAGPDPTTLMAPSDADGLIAVGAVDEAGVVAAFSSRGPTADGRIKPDIAAPGQGVWVAVPNTPDEYGQADGTSLATPLAAGAAALLLEAFPDLDPAAMRAMLQQSSSLADAPNNDLGWGVLDASRPVAALCACVDGDDDGACSDVDCDDADADVSPGQAERCDDGRDNDCDDLVDAADPACAAPGDDTMSTGHDDASAGDDDDAGGDEATAATSGASSDDPAEPTSGDGATGEPADAAADEADGADGCTCSAGRDTWPGLLLGSWLLLGVRRRPRTRRA